MKKLLIFVCLSLWAYEAKDYTYLYKMEDFHPHLLEMHFKLYEGYVKNATDLLEQIKHTDPDSYTYGALKRRFGWEFDGMRLHELYFDNLGGDGILSPKSALAKALEEQFGSLKRWRKDFIATGMIRGIGWSVLYFDPISRQLINVWINEHNVNHLVRGFPILVMDVFEHAYMPQWGLNRAKYIDVFFKNIDWTLVEERYRIAKQAKE
jgi:Fe-Mn family superoxide dismutase